MRESDVQAVLDTLRSGWLTMGPRIKAFEEAFAARVGAKHGVAVSSGTAARILVGRIRPDDPLVASEEAGLAPVASNAAAACWSFADGRPLAMGEGGMITTDDDELAARARLLRQHAMTSGTWDRHRGHSDSYDVVDVGFNFRLDEPRAALGLAQLEHLDEDLGLAQLEHLDEDLGLGAAPDQR